MTSITFALYDSSENAGHKTEHDGAAPAPSIDAGYAMDETEEHALAVNHSAAEVNYEAETSCSGNHLKPSKDCTSLDAGYSSNCIRGTSPVMRVLFRSCYVRSRYSSNDNNIFDSVCHIAEVASR